MEINYEKIMHLVGSYYTQLVILVIKIWFRSQLKQRAEKWRLLTSDVQVGGHHFGMEARCICRHFTAVLAGQF